LRVFFLILKGELDEIMAELEESRRKLVSLKMQKDAAMGMNSSNADAVNGNLSPEKPADRAMGLSELKNSIEEAKVFVVRFSFLLSFFCLFFV
jgi:E3 ubiquitin-protein ligase BRE1